MFFFFEFIDCFDGILHPSFNQTYLRHPQTIRWHFRRTWYGNFIELHGEFSCEPSLTTIIKGRYVYLKVLLY